MAAETLAELTPTSPLIALEERPTLYAPMAGAVGRVALAPAIATEDSHFFQASYWYVSDERRRELVADERVQFLSRQALIALTEKRRPVPNLAEMPERVRPANAAGYRQRENQRIITALERVVPQQAYARAAQNKASHVSVRGAVVSVGPSLDRVVVGDFHGHQLRESVSGPTETLNYRLKSRNVEAIPRTIPTRDGNQGFHSPQIVAAVRAALDLTRLKRTSLAAAPHPETAAQKNAVLPMLIIESLRTDTTEDHLPIHGLVFPYPDVALPLAR